MHLASRYAIIVGMASHSRCVQRALQIAAHIVGWHGNVEGDNWKLVDGDTIELYWSDVLVATVIKPKPKDVKHGTQASIAQLRISMPGDYKVVMDVEDNMVSMIDRVGL